MMRHWAIRMAFTSTLVLGCFFAFGESGMPDFSSMSDVDLLLHLYEEPEAAMEEYKRRAKDYTPQQVREIEAEFFRQIRMPKESVEPTIEELLTEVNQTADVVKRMKRFDELHERYSAADEVAKSDIREAFLVAWAEVPYTEAPDEKNDQGRYRDYATRAHHYFQTEAELVPVLAERCLSIPGHAGQNLFVNALPLHSMEFGALTVHHVERIYSERYGNRKGMVFCGMEYNEIEKYHRILGLCGSPGLEAILRLGTERAPYGFEALGASSAPEAESILWSVYDQHARSSVSLRLEVLRQINRNQSSPKSQAERRDRIRPEILRYLQLPDSVANLWDVQAAVELAKDTKDTYYLPHVESLERAFFNLNSNAYKCPGMDDRMDEALATLQERFDEAKATLADADVTTQE